MTTITEIQQLELHYQMKAGVSGFAGVDAKLKALVAEKHVRQQGKTFNLLDILAFNLKTQAA